MGLNVRLYNIVSDGPYTIRYKSGVNPWPEYDNTTFTLHASGLTSSTVEISGLTFDTQYWIKMIDQTTGRYIIKNIYTNDSKAFSCYDTICFNIDVICLTGTTPTPTPTITLTNTPTITLTNTPTLGTTQTPTQTSAPTLTSTPTITLTSTPTETCAYKAWTIGVCSSTCSGGVCQCIDTTPTTVYTDCNVTNLLDSTTAIYTTSSLNTSFLGFFTYQPLVNTYIYHSTGLSVEIECLLGSGC